MPLPVIANTLRAAVRGLIAGGGRWQNVWHARWDGGGAPPATFETDVAAQIAKLYVGPAIGAGIYLRQQMTPASTIDDIVLTRLDGSSASVVYPIAFAGTGGGNALPPEVAEVLTLRTGLRGRSYRGRIYYPALVSSTQDASGHILGTVSGPLVTQAIGVQNALIAANYHLVVASYHLVLATPISAFSMDSQYDVQRRRKV